MKTFPGIASLLLTLGAALTQNPALLLAQTNTVAKANLQLPAELKDLFEKRDEFILISMDPTNRTVKATWQLPAALKDFLESADEFVLLSLDPSPGYSKSTFKRYPVLGQVEIKAASERTNLIAALDEAIGARSSVTVSNGVVFLGAPFMNCFNPRHGIRAKKLGKTVDLLICFECEQIQINSSTGTDRVLQIAKEPAAIFNAALKKASVPLPKN